MRVELRVAADAGATVIGVNSRNLRTLDVEPRRPRSARAADAEGRRHASRRAGCGEPADLQRLERAGYDAFLVGERLIAQPDPGAALRALRRSDRHDPRQDLRRHDGRGRAARGRARRVGDRPRLLAATARASSTSTQAKAIVAALPPFVAAVGVFVNQADDALRDRARGRPRAPCSSTATSRPGSYRSFPVRVIKAVAVRDASARRRGGRASRRARRCCSTRTIRVKRGGTGRVDRLVDRGDDRARAAGDPLGRPQRRTTSRRRCETVAPYAIDVSSGVELAFGRKDPAKLRALFAALGSHGVRGWHEN